MLVSFTHEKVRQSIFSQVPNRLARQIHLEYGNISLNEGIVHSLSSSPIILIIFVFYYPFYDLLYFIYVCIIQRGQTCTQRWLTSTQRRSS